MANNSFKPQPLLEHGVGSGRITASGEAVRGKGDELRVHLSMLFPGICLLIRDQIDGVESIKHGLVFTNFYQ